MSEACQHVRLVETFQVLFWWMFEVPLSRKSDMIKSHALLVASVDKGPSECRAMAKEADLGNKRILKRKVRQESARHRVVLEGVCYPFL